MAFRIVTQVRAPVKKVFELVEDYEKRKQWMEGLENLEFTSQFDPANPLGATFKQTIREGKNLNEYSGKIVAFQRPNRLGIDMGNAQFTIHADYRFAETAQGTRVNAYFSFSYHNPMAWLMGLLFGWFTKRISGRQMEALKRLAEAAP